MSFTSLSYHTRGYTGFAFNLYFLFPCSMLNVMGGGDVNMQCMSKHVMIKD